MEQRVRELKAALRAARRNRLILLFGVLVFLAAITGVLLQVRAQVTSQEYKDALLKEFQAKLEGGLADDLMRELTAVLESKGPTVRDAFLAQLKKDWPKYSDAIARERQVLMDELEEHLSELVEKQHEKLLARFEKVLAEELPALKDDRVRAQMMANLSEALKRLIKKYYVDEFHRELAEMYETWDEFPAADPAPDEQLEDELIGTLWEVLVHKLAESEKRKAIDET
ncbi:MAG: hypothetical protein D6725_05725 [Planctomycetota bacterium]|nr:MAG: hypothetical protein D6725_05725 [Planctomycetota bacterium]